MSRLAGDMKGFVVLGVYRSTVKKQNKEKKHCYDDTDYQAREIRKHFRKVTYENPKLFLYFQSMFL